jgi:deazaflavin-dependent oxidoreductase (nitroreductase family)
VASQPSGSHPPSPSCAPPTCTVVERARGTAGSVTAAWYGYGVYSRAVNAFSATRPGSWLVGHVAARVDPALFRWSGGRVTVTGVPTLPMLVLTTTGRRSGLPRSVQLAHLAEPAGSWLVVASAMGRDRQPDWLLNLRADPRARVLLPDRELEVDAVELTPDERDRRWPDLVRTVPQLRTYVRRTTRDIPVVRLAQR